MKIYLMQHGVALSEEEDSARPLSDEGRVAIESEAQAIQDDGLKFDVIFTSNKLRATQTAEIIAENLGCSRDDIVANDCFKPGACPEEILLFLENCREKTILIVGHIPSLPKLAKAITGDDVDFQNGVLVELA